MFRNYLKIAIRNLFNSKLFSFINIFGLSVGITCTFLIVLYILDEFSYDRFFKDGDRIYRVALNRVYPDNEVDYAVIPISIGEAMDMDFPEVESCTRVFSQDNEFITQLGERTFRERYVILADSNFFDFFNFSLIAGDKSTVLKTPNGFVLTESTARRYFGDSSAIGKMINVPNGEIMVTGVCKDVPKNSHFRFDFVGNLAITGLTRQPDYLAFSVKTYLKIKAGTDHEALEAKFPDLVERYAAGQIESRMGVTYKEYIAAGNGYNYFLQPLKDIHLHSNLRNEIKPNGNIIYVYIFIIVAGFLLIIACINFMNLATARSTDRALEVGMRKVLGAEKKQLVWQFLNESLATVVFSIIFALVLTELMLPAFNNLAGKKLEIHYFGNWFTLPILLGLGLFVGFIAGSYPSFILSAMQPLHFMKGRFISTKSGSFLRNLLVVFQFSISIILIAVTLLVGKQMDYFMNKDLGFNEENVLQLERTFFLREDLDAFKQELIKYPDIESVASSNTPVSGGYYFGNFFQTSNMSSEVLTTDAMVIDENFIKTLGLTLVEGRNFSKEFNDSLSLIINESTITEFGLENPVGSTLYLNRDEGTVSKMTIVGVVKDFHNNSLHQNIKAFVLFSDKGPYNGNGILNIKIKPENIKKTITYIDQKWQEFLPEQPITYSFLDENLGMMYSGEKTSSQIFGVFSLLAIVIATVGLFGLATFVTQKRTQEIGIRKVMGSTVVRIITLLSGSFTKLIGIAFIIATPLAFLAMQQWLQNFAYKTSVGLWVFILAGLIALITALVTISFHTLKVANANPADSLRYE